MNLRKTFIDNLKKYRKEKSLSQMKLAELCNTATSYIGEIESGLKFPSIDMLQRISETLDVPAYKFFMDNLGNDSKDISYQQRTQLILNIQKAVKEIIKSEFPFNSDIKK